MRRTNWKNVEKSTIELKRRIKNMNSISEYLLNIPEEGFFFDNISKKEVKISECKDSTLRRYTTLLDKYYYLAMNEKDRDMILKKKIEVEDEMNKRTNN